jgi:hypothetical protein
MGADTLSLYGVSPKLIMVYIYADNIFRLTLAKN